MLRVEQKDDDWNEEWEGIAELARKRVRPGKGVQGKRSRNRCSADNDQTQRTVEIWGLRPSLCHRGRHRDKNNGLWTLFRALQPFPDSNLYGAVRHVDSGLRTSTQPSPFPIPV